MKSKFRNVSYGKRVKDYRSYPVYVLPLCTYKKFGRGLYKNEAPPTAFSSLIGSKNQPTIFVMRDIWLAATAAERDLVLKHEWWHIVLGHLPPNDKKFARDAYSPKAKLDEFEIMLLDPENELALSSLELRLYALYAAGDKYVLEKNPSKALDELVIELSEGVNHK